MPKLDVFPALTGNNGWDVLDHVTVAQVGAPTQYGVVEKAGTIGFLGPFEDVDELAQHLGAFLVPQTVGVCARR